MGTAVPGRGWTGSQGRRKVVDTAGQDSTRLPTAPWALRQMPLPAWLTHPADMSPSPLMAKQGAGRQLLTKTVSRKILVCLCPFIPIPGKESRHARQRSEVRTLSPIPGFATHSLQHLEQNTSLQGNKSGFRGAAGLEAELIHA